MAQQTMRPNNVNLRKIYNNLDDLDDRLIVLELGQSPVLVKAATTANITLSGAQTIDGVSIVAGDKVLVKDQSTGKYNGIYIAAASAWSRSTDVLVDGLIVRVQKGTANADSFWSLTTDTFEVGTDTITFEMIVSWIAKTTATANTIAKRDADAKITAAGFIGPLTGNADTATSAGAISAAGEYEAPLKVGSGATTLWVWVNATNHLPYFKQSATAPSSDTDGALIGDNLHTGLYDDPLHYGTGASGWFEWMTAGGKKYIKTGATAPTTDTDGTCVGDQTAS